MAQDLTSGTAISHWCAHSPTNGKLHHSIHQLCPSRLRWGTHQKSPCTNSTTRADACFLRVRKASQEGRPSPVGHALTESSLQLLNLLCRTICPLRQAATSNALGTAMLH
eukprot:11437563-Karenia_brevis.AAC.1